MLGRQSDLSTILQAGERAMQVVEWGFSAAMHVVVLLECRRFGENRLTFLAEIWSRTTACQLVPLQKACTKKQLWPANCPLFNQNLGCGHMCKMWSGIQPSF